MYQTSSSERTAQKKSFRSAWLWLFAIAMFATVLGVLPVHAKAANSSTIYVAGDGDKIETEYDPWQEETNLLYTNGYSKLADGETIWYMDGQGYQQVHDNMAYAKFTYGEDYSTLELSGYRTFGNVGYATSGSNSYLYGIYYTGNLRIKLNGVNSIRANTSKTSFYQIYGIYVTGDLIIEGTGSLELDMCCNNNVSAQYQNIGINVGGMLSVPANVNVNVYATAAQRDSTGIQCGEYMQSAGNMKAYGGISLGGYSSRGFHCGNAMTVSDGTLLGVGGGSEKTGNSYGIFIGGELQLSGNGKVEGRGTTNAKVTDTSYGISLAKPATLMGGELAGYGGWAKYSYGINVKGLTIPKGGTASVTAQGLGNSSEYTEIKESYGIHNYVVGSSDNDCFMDIAGGKVTAKSGNATSGSYCIAGANMTSVTVRGNGELTAETGSGKYSTGINVVQLICSDNAKVAATTLSAESNSAAISVGAGNGSGTGLIVSGGTVKGIAGPASTTDGYSYGIKVRGDIELSGGTVQGETSKEEKTRYSYGIYVSGSNSSFSGGTLIGSGGYGEHTTGIFSDGFTLPKGSTVTIIGKGAFTDETGTEEKISNVYTSTGIESSNSNAQFSILDGTVIAMSGVAGMSSSFSYGIHTKGANSQLVVKGDGVLDVSSDKASDTTALDTADFSCDENAQVSIVAANGSSHTRGLYAKKVTISGGNVTIDASQTNVNSRYNRGVEIGTEGLVMTGGSLLSKGESYGIESTGTINVSGGKLIAIGSIKSFYNFDNPDQFSSPIYEGSEDIDGTNLVQVNEVDYNWKYAKLSGYYVTFHENTTDAVTNMPARQTLKEDEFAICPDTNPVRTGYQFMGWFTDEACTNAYDFAKTPVTKALELYAKWARAYNVTLWPNGHGGSTKKVIPVLAGETLYIPADVFTEENYGISGWYLEAGCENAYDFSTPVNSDFDLYADWMQNAVAVSFHTRIPVWDGTQGKYVEQVVVKMVEKDSPFFVPTELKNLKRDGSFFSCWCWDEEETSPYVTNILSKDTDLYAKWDLNAYVYTESGSNLFSSSLVKDGEMIHICVNESNADTQGMYAYANAFKDVDPICKAFVDAFNDGTLTVNWKVGDAGQSIKDYPIAKSGTQIKNSAYAAATDADCSDYFVLDDALNHDDHGQPLEKKIYLEVQFGDYSSTRGPFATAESDGPWYTVTLFANGPKLSTNPKTPVKKNVNANTGDDVIDVYRVKKGKTVTPVQTKADLYDEDDEFEFNGHWYYQSGSNSYTDLSRLKIKTNTDVYAGWNVKVKDVAFTFDRPVAGESVADTAANVNIGDATGYTFRSEKAWTPASDGAVFENDQTYTFETQLRSADGYVFAETNDISIVVKDDRGAEYGTSGDYKYRVRRASNGTALTFEVTVKLSAFQIKDVSLTFERPAVGLDLSDSDARSVSIQKTDADDRYNIVPLMGCVWMDKDSNTNGLVEEGKTYKFNLHIKTTDSKKAYCFDPNLNLVLKDEAGNTYVRNEAPGSEGHDASLKHYYVVMSDGHNNGYQSYIVNVYTMWGEPTDSSLVITGVNLTLQDNLSFNLYSSKSLYDKEGYGEPYVVFNVNGTEKTVHPNPKKSTETDYAFTCNNIAPHMIGDEIGFTIYVMNGTQQITGMSASYSVTTYCNKVLDAYKTKSKLTTLIVDLLNYGAAAQNYMDYKTDALVNAGLSEEQQSWATEERAFVDVTEKLNEEEADLDDATFLGAALNLGETVSIRYVFTAESLSGLTLKVTDEKGNSWTFTESDFVPATEDGLPANSYSLYCRKLHAGRMSDKVYATLYRDGKKSMTVAYSIESYVSKVGSGTSKLQLLLKAMMKYGDAARKCAEQ